ncbi:MAG TPA: PEGA domain-containing protein [Candidatus Angelobacter sp.]|nr:PEGA domain-containing protein [Candidatus Angelobacter sp.]
MKLSSLLLVGFLLLPLPSLAAKDPADYPLKVYIIQVAWGSHNLRYEEYKATGRGNVWDGETVHAFDFTYDCGFPVRRTAANQPLPAKWKKSQVRLDVLADKIGTNNKYQECELHTTVHSGVYVVNESSISEVPQEEFRKRREQREAARNQSDKPAASKVSVASTPDSAEIEIDGEFMGNTPSVLELDPGEHSIAVRKAGYKPWEKKLKVTAGDIKLNAELEAEGAK